MDGDGEERRGVCCEGACCGGSGRDREMEMEMEMSSRVID